MKTSLSKAEQNSIYYQKTKEKRLKDNKERYHTDEEYRQKYLKWQEAYRRKKGHKPRKNTFHPSTSPEYRKFSAAKVRAMKQGLDFNITLEDIPIIEGVCPYLKKPFVTKGRSPYNPSLDRIDPSKGYIKGNVQIISELANRMKSNASTEDLVEFAKACLKNKS